MKVRLKHQRLARELARSPLTLNRWAQKMGLSSGHLSDLANGKRVYVRPKTRKKLMSGLGLSFDELFEIELPNIENPRPTAARRRPAARPTPPARHPVDIENSGKGDGFMSDFLQDLRIAFRQMRRHPGFAAAAILSLAVGIGANTALFSMVNTVLWKPFPYPEPDRIVRVFSTTERFGLSNLSFPDYADLREQSTALQELAAVDWEPYGLSGGAEALRVGGGRVTAGFFSVMGVQPLLGRTFNEDEDRPDGEPVVVLGERIWKSYFGGDPDIVGRSVPINNQPRTVIGVMPSQLDQPDNARLWVPLARDRETSSRGSHWLQSVGRLKPGATVGQARVELSTLARRLEEEYPATNEGRGASVQTLREALIGDLRPVFLILLGVVALVLLIVCSNVANLLLARGVSRGREMAIRCALGAGGARVVRQLLTESAALAAIGGILGLLLGYWGAHGLKALVPVELPAWVTFELDSQVLIFVLAVSLAAALLSGIFPAFQSLRFDVHNTLREGGGHSNSRLGRHRLRAALVTAEVALSAVLLIGAGLMIRNLTQLGSVDPGFDIRNRLTVGLDLLGHLSKSDDERRAMVDRYLERFQALPGVEAVAVVDRLPLKRRSNSIPVTAEGQTLEEQNANPSPLASSVSPDYFDAMGIPLLVGDTFSENAEQAQRQIVVSRRLADALWPQQNPIGKRLKFGSPDMDTDWFEVRGVVDDVLHLGIDREFRPGLYFSHDSSGMVRTIWVFRTDGDPQALIPTVRAAVAEIDPAQPLHEVMTMNEVVAESFWQWRFFAAVFWIFAGMALILASVGIYGLLAYSVSERTQELGIRIALGAGRAQVWREVLGRAFRLIVVGLAVGLGAGLGLGQVLASLLFEVSAFDPAVFATVSALLLAVGLSAVLLPARRAAKVDPMTALRYE